MSILLCLTKKIVNYNIIILTGKKTLSFFSIFPNVTQSLSTMTVTRTTLLINNTMTINFKSTNIDSIEAFTNELIEQKLQKWDSLDKTSVKKKRLRYGDDINKLQISTESPPSTIFDFNKQIAHNIFKVLTNLQKFDELYFDLKNFSQEQIDNLLMNAIYDKKFTSAHTILNQCIKYKKCPSEKCIFELLEYLSEQNNSTENLLIIRFMEMLRQINLTFYETHLNFEYFIARILWLKGNSDVSLSILKSIYANPLQNDYTKGIMARIFQHIVQETLQNRSEAVLVTLIKLAEHLQTELNDSTVLISIWKNCFLSQWFSDQQIANNLFNKYKNIRIIIGNSTSLLAFNLLVEHNADAMYRLIELYLKYEMNLECKQCLELLFDYQYWRQDLRACSEIMQNSLNLNITLSEIYSQKLIILLLGKKYVPTKAVTPNKFQFKF